MLFLAILTRGVTAHGPHCCAGTTQLPLSSSSSGMVHMCSAISPPTNRPADRAGVATCATEAYPGTTGG
jgi:hypothetical protein